jgi:hypothetical protein
MLLHHHTSEPLLENAVFSVWSVLRFYTGRPISMKDGSNISTVTLQVTKGNGKRTQDHPVPGGYKCRNLALQLEGVSNVRWLIIISPVGLRPENDCAGKG